MNKYTDEIEVSILELCYRILKKWRVMLVMAIIFAIVFSGYSYYKDVQTINELQNTSDDAIILTEEQQEAVDKVYDRLYSNQLLLEHNQTYIDESILMQLDSNQVTQNTMTYILKRNGVSSGEGNIELESVVQYFINSLKNDELYQNVAEAMKDSDMNEVNSAYLAELLQVQLVNDQAEQLSMGSLTDILQDASLGDEKNIMFTVCIKGPSIEFCETYGDCVDSYIKELITKSNNQIGSYSVESLNETNACIADQEIYDIQNEILTSQNTLSDRINVLRTSLDETTLAYVDSKMNIQESAVADIEAENADLEPAISKKYSLLGAIIGIIIVALIEGLRYILVKKLRSVDELRDIYGIQILGDVKKENEKKGVFSGIDTWIYNMFHQKQRQFTNEEAEKMLLAKLSLMIKQQQIKSLYFTGAIMGESEQELCEKLKQQIGNSTEIEKGECILYRADSLEKMANADAVVLVERIDGSMYDEVAEELELCEQQKIPVLGAIAIR